MIAGLVTRFLDENRLGPEEAKLESDLREATFSPEHYPGVANMAAGDDGTIWLQMPVPTGDDHEWRVYSEEGEWIAKAFIPKDLRVMLITGAAVWGVETDELDLNYIIRYPLVKDP